MLSRAVPRVVLVPLATVVALASLLAGATPAAAETKDATPVDAAGAAGAPTAPGLAPLRRGWTVNLGVVATAFPDKGVFLAGGAYRHVYQRSKSRILDGGYVEAGATLGASILLVGGVYVEWLPIKILKLRVAYQGWGWLGISTNLGHGLTFPTRDDPFDRAEIARRKGENVAAGGHRFVFKPRLQLKFWRVILLNDTEVAAWYIHGPTSFWYEPLYNTLIRRGEADFTVTNTPFLLFEVWNGKGAARVLVGALHEFVYAHRAGFTRHRIGGVVVVTPWDRLSKIDRPTLAVLMGANLKDRYRRYGFWFTARIQLSFDLSRPR